MTPRKAVGCQNKTEDIKLDFFAASLLGNLECVFRTRFPLGDRCALSVCRPQRVCNWEFGVLASCSSGDPTQSALSIRPAQAAHVAIALVRTGSTVFATLEMDYEAH